LTTPSPSPFLLLLLLFCSCVQSTFTLCNIPIPSRFICLIRTNCFRAQIRNGSGSGAILIKSNTILFHGSHGLLPQLRSLFRRWWLKFATFSPCELHNLRNSGGRQGRLCATSLHRTGVRLTFDYPKKNHVSPPTRPRKNASLRLATSKLHTCVNQNANTSDQTSPCGRQTPNVHPRPSTIVRVFGHILHRTRVLFAEKQIK
jgi:hypothetical protein